MIGVVLAAGLGERLGETTRALPKTLLAVDGSTTILDIALRNLAAVGIGEVTIITGHAAGAIEAQLPDLRRRHGVRIATVFNDRYEHANNCYSLWLALRGGANRALVVNGDTVHPPSVERALLSGEAAIRIAVDDVKGLGEEEMKVVLDGAGRMRRISKRIDPLLAHGEYIGVSLVDGPGLGGLVDALERTWQRNPSQYYEDGYQVYADAGGEIQTVSIGDTNWVEVDTTDDLRRARQCACRY